MNRFKPSFGIVSLVTDDVIVSPSLPDQRAEPVRRDDVRAALPAPRRHPRRRTTKGENKNKPLYTVFLSLLVQKKHPPEVDREQ